MSKKKEQKVIPRVDATKMPHQWKTAPPLPKSDPLEMDVPIGDKLPRIKVILNSGTNLKSNRYYYFFLLLDFTFIQFPCYFRRIIIIVILHSK